MPEKQLWSAKISCDSSSRNMSKEKKSLFSRSPIQTTKVTHIITICTQFMQLAYLDKLFKVTYLLIYSEYGSVS